MHDLFVSRRYGDFRTLFDEVRVISLPVSPSEIGPAAAQGAPRGGCPPTAGQGQVNSPRHSLDSLPVHLWLVIRCRLCKPDFPATSAPRRYECIHRQQSQYQRWSPLEGEEPPHAQVIYPLSTVVSNICLVSRIALLSALRPDKAVAGGRGRCGAARGGGRTARGRQQTVCARGRSACRHPPGLYFRDQA